MRHHDEYPVPWTVSAEDQTLLLRSSFFCADLPARWSFWYNPITGRAAGIIDGGSLPGAGPEWTAFPVNTHPNTVYVCHRQDARWPAGCCYGGAVTVTVAPGESLDTLRNRIWHEILHAETDGVTLNPDMMEATVDQWCPWYLRWLFRLTVEKWRNYWEHRYYVWMTNML